MSIDRPTVLDTYRYKLWQGRKVVLRGYTRNLQRREREHRVRFPNSHIEQIGEVTTHAAAWWWLKEVGEFPSATQPGAQAE